MKLSTACVIRQVLDIELRNAHTRERRALLDLQEWRRVNDIQTLDDEMMMPMEVRITLDHMHGTLQRAQRYRVEIQNAINELENMEV